jgi:hypothetical protein
MIPRRLGKDPHGPTQRDLDLLVRVKHVQHERLGNLPHQRRVPPPPPLPSRIVFITALAINLTTAFNTATALATATVLHSPCY